MNTTDAPDRHDEGDDRLRTLIARVEHMTPAAPAFDSLRGLRTSTGAHRPDSRAVIAIAATLVLVVGGLVAVGARRSDHSRVNDAPVSKHSVATDLPPGWQVRGAGEQTGVSVDPGFGNVHVFATETAPLGPVLALIDPAAGAGFDLAGTGVVNVELDDGRRAAIGSSHLAMARWLDVEVETGTWVGVIARDISDADLLRIGASLTLDADGASVFDADAHDLVDLGRAPLFGNATGYTLDGSDPVQWPNGLTMTEYASGDGASLANIAAFTPTDLDRAMLGLTGVVSTVVGIGDDDSKPSMYTVDYGANAGFGALRLEGDVAFLAQSSTLQPAQLLAMLQSLASVGQVEWDGLVVAHAEREAAEHPGDGTTETSLAPAPPVSPDGPPERIDVAYDITSVDDSQFATAEIPAGTVELHVTYVGRTMHVEAALDGEVLATLSQETTGKGGATMQGGGAFEEVTDGAYAYLYASEVGDPPAELRVISDGFEYATDFIQFDSTYPVRVAVVLVPPTDGRDEAPAAFIYDAAGVLLPS